MKKYQWQALCMCEREGWHAERICPAPLQHLYVYRDTSPNSWTYLELFACGREATRGTLMGTRCQFWTQRRCQPPLHWSADSRLQSWGHDLTGTGWKSGGEGERGGASQVSNGFQLVGEREKKNESEGCQRWGSGKGRWGVSRNLRTMSVCLLSWAEDS